MYPTILPLVNRAVRGHDTSDFPYNPCLSGKCRIQQCIAVLDSSNRLKRCFSWDVTSPAVCCRVTMAGFLQVEGVGSGNTSPNTKSGDCCCDARSSFGPLVERQKRSPDEGSHDDDLACKYWGDLEATPYPMSMILYPDVVRTVPTARSGVRHARRCNELQVFDRPAGMGWSLHLP